MKNSKRQEFAFVLSDALLDSLEDAAALVDAAGHITRANEAWRQMEKAFPWLGGAVKAKPVLDEAAFQAVCLEGDVILSGLRNIIKGLQTEFGHEFFVTREDKPCWLRFRAKALTGEKEGFAILSLHDVTDLRKTEQELRESHALFNRIIDEAGEGFFIYDKEGRFLMHNTTFLNLFCLDAPSVVGKRIEEVFRSPLAQTARSQNELVLATGRAVGYELTLNAPHGKRNIQVGKGIYRNHRYEAVGVIGVARDVTERKQAEENLAKSERYFRALIEKSRDCIVTVSARGRITYASQPAKEIFGFALEEIVGTDLLFWIHPDDVQFAMQRFQEALELPDAPIVTQVRMLCKDGQWKWAESTATNLLDDPAMQAIVLNVRDISERKMAEQQLRHFETIVESSIDGIFSVDLEGKITSWNSGARRIFGYSASEALGMESKILIPEDRYKEACQFAEATGRGKSLRDFETVRLGRGGVPVEVSLTLSPIFGQDGRCTGVVAIVRDITERRRLEREVLEIADFEKHRIGQDLHDDLCQHLVAISMIGNMLYADLVGKKLSQAENARQITEMIRNAVDHARILAKGLPH